MRQLFYTVTKCYSITQNVTWHYCYNAITLGAYDFLSCFKVLEINIFENLALNVLVTHSLLRIRRKTLKCSAHKGIGEVESKYKYRKAMTNRSNNADL